MSDFMFNPIQCTSEQFEGIKNQNPIDAGCLYFLTDTKQMFLARQNDFVEMCGGTGIIYGDREINYPTNGSQVSPQQDFNLSDLETEELPLINDLILNSDGCFYRVNSIDGNVIETTRLTLRGSGGGGGTGSPDSPTSGNLLLKTSSTIKYFSVGQDAPAIIDLEVSCPDATNTLYALKLSWVRNDFSNPFDTILLNNFPVNRVYSLELNKYLSLIESKGNPTKIYIQAMDNFGRTVSETFDINFCNLRLSTNEIPLLNTTISQPLNYKCSVGGTANSLLKRTIYYKLYEENKLKANPNTEPDFEYEVELGSTETGEISQNLDLSQLPNGHGVYTMQVSVQGVIGTTSVTGQTLTHRVLVYDNSVRTPLFAVAVPSTVQRYIKTYIPILLSYDQNKNYQMRVFIDGEETNALYITPNVLKNDFSVEFSTVGIKKLQFKIEELGIDVSFSLAVEKYTDDLPVIRLDHGDLKLNLTASGQTNGAVHPEIWASKVSKSNIAATLDGFYFGSVNGWMTDSNNLDYLKVSQGAEVTLSSSDYTPFTKEGVGVKGINQSGLTVELDFMIDGVTDYNANLIECLSYQEAAETSIATGFTITGDTFKYYASGSELVSLNLVQNERIRLSFVMEPKSESGTPMCYTYLNGIISNIKKRGSSNFENSATEAELKINSAGGTIHIYNIRIYEAAIDSSIILNNYQATDTLENREKNYRQNTIRIDGKISLEEIEKETYELKIPYVKIVGGYKANKDFSMQPKNSAGVPGLPTAKNDYKAIDIEIVYPLIKQNPYFKEYINYLNPNAKTDEEKTNRSFKITTQYEDSSLNVLNAFGKKPTTGAIMYAQGTSSLEYPVKNIRVKLKGDNAKFVVRPDIAPVELITFKADYMESSGSHNTGAANYIDDLYDSIHIATPAQEYFEDKKDEYGEIVSCIKGHPCIIFWCPGVDKNGNLMDINDPNNYEYIGKYNFNLDKATPEPFGFLHVDDESFGYLTDEEGNLVLDDQGNKQNSIYCFEFLDNVVNVCNFQSDTESTYVDYNADEPKDPDLYEINNLSETERYRSTWYNNRINEDGEVVPGWTRGFESRYPEDKIGATDANALWPLASWINSLYDKRFVQNPAQIEEANSEFFANYWKYLDEDFLLAYYVITETLLMADSRVKNMMIATWGKEWRFRTVQTDANGNEIVTISKERPSSGSYEESYDYIWYPIFYDMDTMLGLDNIGDPVKKYYDEDTVESTFNGAEILWKFVRDTLQSKIRDTYRDIEDSDYFLSETIIPYFTNNQSNLANEVLYNEDALYKYVTPVREGYAFNGSIGRQDRLYAAQGSRELSRKYFINNRLQFLSGKYNTNSYQNRDRIIFRCSQELDNLVVDPSTTFEFTSLKTGYAGVHVGAEAPYANVKFIGQQTKTVVVPEDAMKNASGSECYLYGVSNLSSIGDLSDKYITCFTPSTTIDRPFLLTELKLGNHTEGYNNPNWFSESATLDLKSFKFLQDFNFENCSGYKYEIDFKDNTQLRRILLNGSSTSGITLPVQGYIEELRLPTTMSNVCIDSHPNLTTDKFTYGFFNYQTDEYVNDFSNLEHLKLKNTGIDTYSIIKAVLAKDEELGSNGKFKTYCLHGFTWEIDSEDDLVIENDIITGIKVLDKLASDKYTSYDSSQPKSEALSGTIQFKNITKTVSEYLLYEKYNTVFPNVIIDLDGVQLQSATTVTFKTADGNFNHKVIKTNGTKTLAEIAATVIPPEKGQTNEIIYTFANVWVANDIYYLDQSKENYEMVNVTSDPVEYEQPTGEKVFKVYNNTNSNSKKMYVDIDANTKKLVEVKFFDEVIPTSNLILIPFYIASDRIYTVTYVCGDQNKTQKVFNYLYNWTFASNTAAPLFDYVPDDDKLTEHERYSFKGWITSEDYENFTKYNIAPTSFIDLSGKITQNMVIYAYHVIEDAREHATDLAFFELRKQDLQYTNGDATTIVDAMTVKDQWVIDVKPEYRSTIAGKITLPNEMPNPNNSSQMVPITTVGRFSSGSNSQITHIYFMENNSYAHIGCWANNNTNTDYASFYTCKKLEAIYIPEGHDHITHINNRSFYSCPNLTTIPSSSLKYIGYRAFESCGSLTLETLPDTISILGEQAFMNAKGLQLKKLPYNLTAIQKNTFTGCTKLKIYHFGIQEGIAESNKVQYIAQNAFSTQNQAIGTKLYFYPGITTIEDGAFAGFIGGQISDYAGKNMVTIFDYGNYFNNVSDAAKLFSATNPSQYESYIHLENNMQEG